MWIILGIVLIILICYISTYNKFKKLIIKVDEADSGIDVALTKRYDLITKMVDVVKGYTKHEKETILEVIKLRKHMSINEKNEVLNKMNNSINKIEIIAENYPDLKASENFKILQKSLLNVEEHLAASRRMYNSNVSIYNQYLESFPSMIIGSILKLTKKEYFEANDEKTVNISLM